MRSPPASSLFLIALSVSSIGTSAVASGTGSGSGTGGGASAPSAWLPWVDCAFDGSALAKPRNFDCMTLQVPLCYRDMAMACTSNATHALRLMRRQTNKSAADAPTVWIAAESSALGKTADLMERIALQQGAKAINVYAMETRHANPPVSQDCGALAGQYGAQKIIDGTMLDTVAKCRQWISASFGANGMHALSLDSAARDLTTGFQLVQSKELKTNPNVYLLAIGKASRVVQRLVTTSGISNVAFAGFIFDTPHMMKMLPTQDEIVGAAMSRFLDGCDSDVPCQGHYMNLSLSMRDVLKQLEEAVDQPEEGKQPPECIRILKNVSYVEDRDLKPSHGLRRYIVTTRQRMSAYQVIAPLLYRAHRCEDATAFEKMVKEMGALNDGLPPVPRAISAMSNFVDRVVAYSEFWPTPMPSRDQLVKSLDVTLLTDGPLLLQQPSYCVYQASNSSTCAGFYKRTPAVNASRALVYSPPSTSSSVNSTTGLIGPPTADVLILTSRISTVASSTVSEQLYEDFTSGNSSNRTAVLIQSDNPAANEVEGDHFELLLRVVGQFVTRQAKPLAGKWYIRDLLLDNASMVAVARPSTLEMARIQVNFTLTALQMAYLKPAIGYDPYKEPKMTAPTDCSECEAKEDAERRTFVVLVCVAMGLFLAWMAWFTFFRTSKKATTTTTTTTAPVVVTHSEYY